MQNPKDKDYPLEEAAERLLDEMRASLRRVVGYIVNVPKEKSERMIHTIEVVAWVMLTIAIIMRMA